MRKNKWITLLSSIFLMVLFSACGREEIARTQQITRFLANAFSTKVDLVLVLDDSPSASFGNGNTLPEGAQEFVNNLASQNGGWDIRIVSMALSSPNRHSLVWQNRAPILATSNVSASNLIDSNGDRISTQAELDQLTSFYYIDNSVGLFEPGLDNIQAFLEGYATQSNFIRPDAQLAIVVFSNGNDISETTTRQGFTEPAPDVSASYINDLINIKSGVSSHVRFYAMVSPYQYWNRSCNNNNANPGTRYKIMQDYFAAAGGYTSPDLNICEQGSFQTAMSLIANQIRPIVNSTFNRIGGVCNNIQSSVDLNSPSINTQVSVNGFLLQHDGPECQSESAAASNPSCQGWRYEGYFPSGSNLPDSRILPEPGEPVRPGHVIRFNGTSRYFSGDSITVGC